MIEYFDNYDLAKVDGYSFRRDKKTGYFLSSKKIEGKRQRLHVYIWEKEHGKVPQGYHVHHKDENKLNNEVDNLKLLEGKRHSELHGRNLSDEERQRRALNVVSKGMPAAKEWHKSQEGYIWHSEHAKETMSKRKPKTYRCSNCGKDFKTTHIYSKGSNTFCTNSCKAAYRRKSGADDVIKICEGCGKEYVGNKYQKTKYCKDCQNRKGYPR